MKETNLLAEADPSSFNRMFWFPTCGSDFLWILPRRAAQYLLGTSEHLLKHRSSTRWKKVVENENRKTSQAAHGESKTIKFKTSNGKNHSLLAREHVKWDCGTLTALLNDFELKERAL